MRVLSHLSREYVEGKVAATDPAGAAIDPAELTVQFAFMAGHTEPGGGDWLDAIRLRDDVFGILVGPGALVLTVGSYTAWFQVVDDPEKPAAAFGTLRID